MKIWICGSHSTGKTTLARYISNQYNLPMISETARQILSLNEQNINTLRYDLDTIDKYQQQVFDRQIEEESKYSDFVADRSVIDILAYSASHARIFPQLLQSSRLADCISILKEPSSILFFVSPSQATLTSDGVREALNWDGIISISAQIKLLLEMFEIRFFEINNDSMQARVRLIDSVLSLCK